MKARTWLILSVALLGVATPAAGDFEPKPLDPNVVAKARPKHGEIEKQRAKRTTDSKIEKVDKPIRIEKIRSNKTESLLDRSTVICYQDDWTIVPKGSIMHAPPHLARWIDAERKGKLMPWKTFFAKNRGWIETQAVSLAQARGDEPLPEGVRKKVSTSGRVIVAVCHDGPISMKQAEGQGSGKLAKQKAPVGPK